MDSSKKIPDLVLAQRKKGTEIHRRGDIFYLQFYYRIYGKLIEKELLNYYSVQDVIEYLKRVHLLKIKENTQFAEIPKKIKKTYRKFGIRTT